MRAYMLIAAILSIAACTSPTHFTKVEVGDVTVNAEIADTFAKRALGLMNRSTLPENDGMLFIFDGESHRSFWMKDTLIPLDIIFIGAEGTIVDVTTMQPCKSLFCENYRSKEPAKYVLEVNAGFVQEHGIEIGDTIGINV